MRSLSACPTTLELAVSALIIATIFGFAGGILSAIFNRNPIGIGITGLAVLGFSIPEFVLGVLAGLIFGVKLGWLPVSGIGRDQVRDPSCILSGPRPGGLTDASDALNHIGRHGPGLRADSKSKGRAWLDDDQSSTCCAMPCFR